MGTMISLSLGNLEIDWGKNEYFKDHSHLFQHNDIKPIPHWYVDPATENDDDNWKLKAEYQDGFTSPLNKVIDRLALLGYTFKNANKVYAIQQSNFYYEDEEEKNNVAVTFSELAEAFRHLDISFLSEYNHMVTRELDNELNIKITEAISIVRGGRPFQNWDFVGGTSENNLDCYALLNLFSLNPAAQNLPVAWGYQPLIDSGWARVEHFVKPLDPSKRFLIVTEGSTDASIIRHAFKLLKPQIEDFFHYVDMKEGYPFSGTGSLINFVKGLISIGVQNNIIIIFDNDAEGAASFKRCREMNLPKNMTVLKLPTIQEFSNFPTIGPNGQFIADINGKGAAIECYLDLGPDPVLRWNNYNTYVEAYQGELIAKKQYQTHFFEQSDNSTNYNFSKISSVLEMIITSCVEMQEDKLSRELDFQMTLNE